MARSTGLISQQPQFDCPPVSLGWRHPQTSGLGKDSWMTLGSGSARWMLGKGTWDQNMVYFIYKIDSNSNRKIWLSTNIRGLSDVWVSSNPIRICLQKTGPPWACMWVAKISFTFFLHVFVELPCEVFPTKPHMPFWIAPGIECQQWPTPWYRRDWMNTQKYNQKLFEDHL